MGQVLEVDYNERKEKDCTYTWVKMDVTQQGEGDVRNLETFFSLVEVIRQEKGTEGQKRPTV